MSRSALTRAGRVLALGAGVLLMIGYTACSPSEPPTSRRAGGGTSDSAIAAEKTYVAPGDLDEYYFFASGGHSGNVYVYGIPSMRHLSTIPVFTPYPATGYGFDDESKKMLGDLTWGDAHHPALSETNGDYDGRWLFINEMNGRVARIDLRDFKTKQIYGPIPNISGNHGSSFITPNSEYLMVASRFSIPIPKGTYAPIDKYATEYKGVIGALAVDPKTGNMDLGFQILMPPFDYDIGDAGKLASDGWMFLTAYNAERAVGKLEVVASQRDRDYIAAVDWKAAAKAAAAVRKPRREVISGLSRGVERESFGRPAVRIETTATQSLRHLDATACCGQTVATTAIRAPSRMLLGPGMLHPRRALLGRRCPRRGDPPVCTVYQKRAPGVAILRRCPLLTMTRPRYGRRWPV